MEGTAIDLKKANRERWRYLVLGTLSMLFLGVIYAWSVVKVPLTEAFGWNPNQMSMNYALTFCFFCAGGMLGSYLSGKVGARITILIGGILFCLGYFASARLTTSNVVLLYLCYAAPIGGGTGMAYNTILSWVGAWFPDKRGTCSGILMMGFGFSALLLGKVLSWMFYHPAIGWRVTYMALGGVTLAVLLLCAALFRRPAPWVEVEVEHPPRVDESGEETPGFKSTYTPAEMLRRPSFWRFYIYGILISGAGGAVFAFAYDLCLSLGAGISVATTLVGVLSACNGMSRILVGMLYDRLGHRRTMFLSSFTVLLATVTLLIAVLTNSLAVGILGLCINGFSYGSGPVVSATVINNFFGTKHFAANYSINNTKTVVCSFSSMLATFLLTATGSYVVPFMVMVGFGAAAFALHFTIRRA